MHAKEKFMKKGLLIVALLCLICIPFSILAFAEETEAPSESIVLLVGTETKEAEEIYSWIDALQYVEDHATDGAFKLSLQEDITVETRFQMNKRSISHLT